MNEEQELRTEGFREKYIEFNNLLDANDMSKFTRNMAILTGMITGILTVKSQYDDEKFEASILMLLDQIREFRREFIIRERKKHD